MDRANFWTLLDQPATAKNKGLLGLFSKPAEGPRRPSLAPDVLKARLEPLSSEEIQSFAGHFNDVLVELNRWELWGAGYVIQEGMSDDSFHYFRTWLVGKGEAAVQQALNDPDGLGPYIDDPEVENELLEYVTIELLEERGVGDPREGFETSPDDEPSGEPFDEETVAERFPKLAASFGDR